MTETSQVVLAKKALEMRDASDQAPGSGFDSGYWHELIPETEAADFLDVTPRSLQSWRQRGGGPPFFRLSARCVKYTRYRLKRWYDARMRSSTSDMGQSAA